MPFKPAPDWISAFPEEDQSRRLPPARKRTRTGPPRDTSDLLPNTRDLEPAKPSQIDTAEKPGARSPNAVYEVGYGKPPVTTRFKPGQSGNARGRPKGAKGLNTIVRKTLGGKLAVRTSEGTRKISKIEAVLQKTLEKALKGDARAQLELIKLWRAAVPDTPDAAETAVSEDNMSQADLAILAAYEAQLAARTGDAS